MENRLETDPRTAFGHALRAHRRGARLTQRELAAKAGLGIRTLCDLERGTAAPRPATAALLVAALDLARPAAEGFHALALAGWRSARR
ncbi:MULTISPECIES: helix-turn-helix transcriptional regulator [Kitasatospora]|uniref:Putative transcriptional regulator n=1 Tax=Kitasatospora setae (strain ATCC 33774 / DSM 43861 / JCM 3304 / KCC A-0304 / NBRC 14216 / KM-6054) TaxID=452652 RepID=E4MZ86_KITSK|nr:MULTISPECIES: helix-turn-helix transcriptional regulator [Kitasatospora]BAJ29660.1 putative transcriptional regulator [Kitasatospora setae KM-6054]